MKIVELKCPSCKAELEVDDGLDTFYCRFCGQKIMLDGMSETSLNARMQAKKMEHEERLAEKEMDLKKFESDKKATLELFKEKKELFLLPFIIILILLLFIMIELFPALSERSSKKQEEELQEIVDEVMIDIKEGNYDEAYIKANTIYYTEGYSSEVEEKWDNTRETLLKKIKEAEKEAESKKGNDKS